MHNRISLFSREGGLQLGWLASSKSSSLKRKRELHLNVSAIHYIPFATVRNFVFCNAKRPNRMKLPESDPKTRLLSKTACEKATHKCGVKVRPSPGRCLLISTTIYMSTHTRRQKNTEKEIKISLVFLIFSSQLDGPAVL